MGSVLRALLKEEVGQSSRSYSHAVASLETINDATKNCFVTLGIQWAECANAERINTLVEDADIVLVHWWNHPLLMRLLFNGLPLSRLVLWSHVNGYYTPQSFFRELFDVPDLFVFATEASVGAPVVKRLSDEAKKKLRVIRSCAGVPDGATETCPKDGPFCMGYVGTVEPAKMHAEFLKMCAAAGIPARCVVAGGPAHEQLRADAERKGLASKFEILGPVGDPLSVFKQLHVLAYPLTPRHYGTGEQVLIEAMAFCAVPVVLANPPEKAIVGNGKTGLIANTPGEFTAALRHLADNPAERERLAAAGHRFVLETCGIEHSIKAFHELFEEALRVPKRSPRLALPAVHGVSPGSPSHLFLASCGDSPERKLLESLAKGMSREPLPEHFKAATRGTPFHYLDLLGRDPSLELICEAVKEEAYD
jgi:glycosyltransferase involved in cell wall biosynthesis